MSGSALGAALEIPKSALDKIKEADDKLVKLQQTAKDTASSVKTSFAAMEGGTKGFIGALDQIITKLGTIDTKSKSMSGSLNNLGATKAAQDVTQMNGAITKAAENIERMSNKNISLKFSTLNIAEIKESISGIDKQLRDTENLLNRQAQQALVDMRTALQEELKEQQRSTQKRILNVQKATDSVNKETDKETEHYLESLNRRIIAAQQYQARISNIQSMRDAVGDKVQSSVDAEIKAENDKYLASLQERIKQEQSYQTRMAELANKRAKIEADAEKAVEAEITKETEERKKQQEKQFKQEQAYQSRMKALAEKRAKIEADAQKSVEAEIKRDNDNYMRLLNERIMKAQEYQARMKAIQDAQKEATRKTYSGALAYSDSASTIKEHQQAVSYLKEAKLTLDATDKKKIDAINSSISTHNKILKECGYNARQLGEQYSYIQGYLSRLAQRTAVVFSMSAAKGFVENIAEVRGQMEMSQRSLESILQNKPKADEIFNKTVELAVKSPFRIKDLVDYTRQLSAYRIESDKLYDTTKRLADVSAGLGVDMGRLILAYGQVKAAAYLRGSEVRQFTEAGVNMYGELQQYFKEVKGEAYTTAQIVDMISKRKVTFEDVEAIFQRMTDKGGTFYNMQEIQAETLQGKISNLHDAFDVMLNDIGKDKEGLFKGLITTTTSLLDNWKAIASIVEAIIAMFATVKLQSMFMKSSLGMAFSQASGTNAQKMKALWVNAFESMGKAAKAFGSALKTSLVGLGIYAAIELVTTIIGKWNKYNEEVAKAKENTVNLYAEITKINTAYNKLYDKGGKDQDIDKINKNNKELEKNYNKRRLLIQDLLNQATKEGLSISINIDDIKDNELDKTYRDILNKYQQFVIDMEKININAASNDKWNTWVTSGLKDNSKAYHDAVVDFVSQNEKMNNVVIDFQSHYKDIESIISNVAKRGDESSKKLAKSMQDAWDSLNNKQGGNESTSQYFERVYKAMAKLNQITFNTSWGQSLSKRLIDIGEKFGVVTSKGKKLEDDIRDVFADVSETVKKNPIEMKARIDTKAAIDGWDQFTKEYAYKMYNIKVNIDTDDAKKKVYTLLDDIQAEFDRRKIKLNVSKNDVVGGTYSSAVGLLEKDAKALKADIEELQKSTMKYIHGYVFGLNQKIDFNGGKVDGNTVFTKAQALRILRNQYNKVMRENAAAGGDPFAKENAKAAKDAEKNQRDILQERVNLLKEMNDKYEELQDHMNDKSTLSSVRQYFADSAKNVGWNADDILPDAHSVIKKLKELAKQASTVSKRGQILRIAADIQAKWDKKYNEQQLDEAKKDVEDAFSKLDLFKKLREEGLNKEQINAMFGDLTTSFEDARKRITDTFEAKYGKDHTSEKWGDKETKEYEDAIKKLDEKVAQDQVAQAQELIKAYKTQLTEQLQLDKWYYGERIKIRENANLNKDPELQKQLEDNLTSQFKKKQADIDWKNFQNSDTYIAIFENLEHTSTKALDYMIEKLRGVREQLKGLDPTQVKAITEQIEKLEQTKNAKNPFKAFTSGYKEMIKASKEFKKNGGIDAWVKANKQNDAEKADIQDQEALVASLEEEYNQLSENKELESDKAKQLKVSLDVQKAILNQKKADNKATQEGFDKLNNAKGASEKAKNKFSTSVTDITSMVSAMGQAFGSLGQNLGIADDYFTNSVNLIDHAGQAVGSFYSKNWAGVVSNAVGAVGDIINLFSSESKIDKEIERQERAVTRLQNAYSDLKQSMDDAFDIENLQKYHNKSVETLEDEKKAYEAMINAERGRKNPDDGKIEQWQQEIQSLDKTIKELGESLTESLGGFGSEANYKSAAQAFADAWVDAFNEGSDALDALNDKFDDYFNDMLKKQLMQRATSKFIEPILKAFDDAVAEGSEGGNNGYELTKDEIAHIKDLKETNLKAFDEYARNLMDVLGVKPSGSSNLSNLQQGIQAVTETTAQALESILNSMRLYVSQQQSDVAAIRTILEQRLGAVAAQAVEGGASNQMLALMEQQAGYLKQICDNWSSVLKSGHKQGGKGLKVFMN